MEMWCGWGVGGVVCVKERIGYKDMIIEWRCGVGQKREKKKSKVAQTRTRLKKGKKESEKYGGERRKEKERWQYGRVGRMGVGAYRRLLLPETWPPEPAWALDAHVEQFTVMEL